MGLDMYLVAEKYVGGWNHRKDAGYDKLVEATGMRPDDGNPSFEVHATVGYWRKANAIHKWFVDNVQGGRDECQESRVSREQLEALRADCAKVLESVETVDEELDEGTEYVAGVVRKLTKPGQVVAQPEIAAATLPTQDGFFFGCTNYDEYYLTDLRETVATIDRVLSDKAFEDCDFYYRASW